jgi:hypothetical protein
MQPAVPTNYFNNYGLSGQPLQLATSIYQQGSPTFNAAIASPYTAQTNYGFINAAPQQQQQQSGPSFGLNNLSTAGRIIGNGGTLPQSGFINNIGAGLGFAPGASAPTYLATGALPWQTAGAVANPALLSAGPSNIISSGAGGLGSSTALGGSTLSSTLGAAGIGAFAGNFLGKIGGNPTGGSIGGGVGAAIGSAFGPVGSVVGGALGGVVGGFFGGKKPATSASGFSVGALNPDGTFVNASTGTKNASAEQGQAAMDTLGSYLTSASKALGIEFKPGTSFDGGYNSLRSGGPYPDYINVMGENVDGKGGNTNYMYYDISDPTEKDRVFREAVKIAAARSGYTDMGAIDAHFDQQKFLTTTQGKQAQAMPFIPIKNDQRFADFMSKFKTQGTTPNANATPTPV